MAGKRNKRVIVVGGGAAGIMAAVWAARMGAQVVLLERNPRIGKKILVTGNGRCNFTNLSAGDVLYYKGNNPKFVHSALAQFDVPGTISFFEELGICHRVEEGGKVFPMSGQASSVLDVLLAELNELSVEIVVNAFVRNIIRKKDGFSLQLDGGPSFDCDSVVLAAGGKAKPSTGSDGNGYTLAQGLGHSITDIFPGLVQLKLEGGFFHRIKGVKFDGTVELMESDRTIMKGKGDILFADYGISGPPVLHVSRRASQLLNDNKKPVLKVIIIDTMNVDELDKYLETRFYSRPGKTVEFSLVGLINKRLIPVVLKAAGINDFKKPVSNISANHRRKIAQVLTDWRFTVTGTKSWPSAQITAGGVCTREIDQKTMESRLVQGLFFAGEIMDIDGECGGFNLQWAWSSGYVAGVNAAL